MANPYFTDFRTGGLLQDNIPTQTVAPTGILQEPMPNYDVNLQPFGDLAKDLAVSTYQSASIPRNTLRDIFSGIPISREKMMGDVTQFGFDFGMLPALAVGAFANPSRNALMSAGGVDTVSGGSPRGFDVDELGFYSKALEEAKRLPQAKGTGEQFRKMLLSSGVKPDEIKFTPELEGLLSQPKVTREELVGLLEENRIRPQETVYFAGDSEFEGMNFPSQAEQLDVYDAYGRDYVTDEAQYLMEDMPEDVAEAFGRTALNATEVDIAKVQKALEEGNVTALVDRDSELFIDNEDIRDVIGTIEDAAETLVSERYSYDPILRLQDPDTGYEIVGNDDGGYTIRNEGGDTLRGERYSLNEARVEAETDAIDRGIIGYDGGETRFMEYTEDGGSNYREMLLQVPEYAGKKDDFTYSGHFDEPDIVVHARTKDREFGVGENATGSALYVEELQSDWGQQGRQRGFDTPKEKQDLQSAMEQYEPFLNEKNKQMSIKNEAKRDFAKLVAKQIGGEVSGSSSGGSVYLHDKPVMNDYNAEEILTSGSGEIRLYDPLSGQYRRVSVTVPKEIKDKYKSSKKRWDELDEESKDLQKLIRKKADTPLAPFVGNSEKFAEVGIKRLISQAAKEGKKSVVFSSGDVQLGRWGEDGLETFYDKILPKVGKKVTKRLDPDAFAGIKFVEDATGDVSGDRFVIEITPKMREAVQKGQPLFTAPTVPVPSTGLFADDPKDLEEYYSRGIF